MDGCATIEDRRNNVLGKLFYVKYVKNNKIEILPIYAKLLYTIVIFA